MCLHDPRLERIPYSFFLFFQIWHMRAAEWECRFDNFDAVHNFLVVLFSIGVSVNETLNICSDSHQMLNFHGKAPKCGCDHFITECRGSFFVIVIGVATISSSSVKFLLQFDVLISVWNFEWTN